MRRQRDVWTLRQRPALGKHRVHWQLPRDRQSYAIGRDQYDCRQPRPWPGRWFRRDLQSQRRFAVALCRGRGERPGHGGLQFRRGNARGHRHLVVVARHQSERSRRPGAIDTTGGNIGLSGSLSGPGGLTKIGPGILILSGSNGYGGGTDVEAGTLWMTDASAMPVGTSLTVGAGGTLIFGASAELGAGERRGVHGFARRGRRSRTGHAGALGDCRAAGLRRVAAEAEVTPSRQFAVLPAPRPDLCFARVAEIQ